MRKATYDRVILTTAAAQRQRLTWRRILEDGAAGNAATTADDPAGRRGIQMNR
jgi:hypothetical protein